MILLSNSTAQVLAPGQAITFDTLLLRSGDGECCHNNAARTINTAKLRKCGIYEIHYQANFFATDTVAPIQLSVQVDGTTLPETTAIVTVGAIDTVEPVSRTTLVRNICADVTTVTVVNTGTTTVTVEPNASLMIKRLSGGAY